MTERGAPHNVWEVTPRLGSSGRRAWDGPHAAGHAGGDTHLRPSVPAADTPNAAGAAGRPLCPAGVKETKVGLRRWDAGGQSRHRAPPRAVAETGTVRGTHPGGHDRDRGRGWAVRGSLPETPEPRHRDH